MQGTLTTADGGKSALANQAKLKLLVNVFKPHKIAGLDTKVEVMSLDSEHLFLTEVFQHSLGPFQRYNVSLCINELFFYAANVFYPIFILNEYLIFANMYNCIHNTIFLQ